jgi:hypothetical protein
MGLKKWIFRIFLILLFSVMVPLSLYSGAYDLNVIDTPKTYTSYKGDLRFDFSMYDRGGILGSAVLAITDFAFLGIYFDIGQVIGSEPMEWNQPGVLARFLVSDGSTFLPQIAIGYSYFMRGEINKVKGVTVNGLYVVGSSPFFLVGNEQSISYGLRYPIIPLSYSAPKHMSVFLGVDMEFSPVFGVKGEIENVQFSEEWWYNAYYNFAVAFNIVDMIGMSVEFKYSPSINTVIRLLRIGYTTQF